MNRGFGSSSTRYRTRSSGSNPICAALFGIFIFLAAFPLLVWNEKRAIQTTRSLDEVSEAVKSIDGYSSFNQNQLVHISEGIEELPVLNDDSFGISMKALAIKRTVEMYQWKESERRYKRREFGREVTEIEYNYDADWYDHPIDSVRFHERHYDNPSYWQYRSKVFTARNALLGDFSLPSSFIATHLPPNTEVPLALPQAQPIGQIGSPQYDSEAPVAIPVAMPMGVRMADGALTTSQGPHPMIGDIRITYEISAPDHVSIIGQQVGKSFAPYHAPSGDDILIVKEGVYTARGLIEMAHSENTVKTYVLRGAGFGMMVLGVVMMLSPVASILAWMPLVGGLLSSLATQSSFIIGILVALVCSLPTIGLAWFAFRPQLSIMLLAIAGGAFYVLRNMWNKPAQAPRAEPVQD
eukprot:TRINITY_DN64789_c0_g1_i1.p1 TRINITY_DN64789_c0_g1~~TRINITY_DN64789_c0_g1_i1.p1  ORF type:complete len:410 (+),score=113.02 TRINITY_DN64789_c0_g1_i1:30-1259(+)